MENNFLRSTLTLIYEATLKWIQFWDPCRYCGLWYVFQNRLTFIVKPCTTSSFFRRNPWGNMSYADLITQAIKSSPEQRLTLAQIYEWLVKNVTYFREKGDNVSSTGWKVRTTFFYQGALSLSFNANGLMSSHKDEVREIGDKFKMIVTPGVPPSAEPKVHKFWILEGLDRTLCHCFQTL